MVHPLPLFCCFIWSFYNPLIHSITYPLSSAWELLEPLSSVVGNLHPRLVSRYNRFRVSPLPFLSSTATFSSIAWGPPLPSFSFWWHHLVFPRRSRLFHSSCSLSPAVVVVDVKILSPLAAWAGPALCCFKQFFDCGIFWASSTGCPIPKMPFPQNKPLQHVTCSHCHAYFL